MTTSCASQLQPPQTLEFDSVSEVRRLKADYVKERDVMAKQADDNLKEVRICIPVVVYSVYRQCYEELEHFTY